MGSNPRFFHCLSIWSCPDLIRASTSLSLAKPSREVVDTRVKPAHDGWGAAATSSSIETRAGQAGHSRREIFLRGLDAGRRGPMMPAS